MSGLSDEELFVSFARRNDRGAFETLVRRYQHSLCGYLTRYTGDIHLAEDIFQETFVKVFEKKDLYREDKPFKPWLFSIATNTAKDKFRERKHLAVLSESEGVASESSEPDRRFGRKETESEISQAVARLPEHQREVFLLREYEELPYAEISVMVQRPLNTVKSDMRRALQSLRGLLDYLADGVVEGG